MSYPRLTVVTPSFNQSQYLEETLRSVLSQREDVHEYFVLDGGSTDGSADIIAQYAPDIDYWVSQPDGGQSAAIREGFARATGDVLIWINSDDLVLPGAFSTIRTAFAANPALQVLTGDLLVIDSRSHVVAAHRYREPSLTRAYLGMNQVCQQGWYFRRDLYEHVGGVDASLSCAMDADLWYRFLVAKAAWSHIRQYLGAFRMHEASKTSTWGARWQKDHEVLTSRYPAVRARNRNIWWGRHLSRLLRLLDGRYVGARRDTRRWQRQRVQDVSVEARR